MQEVIRNAVEGWFRFTDAGKYAVLFLGILLYLWYLKEVPGDGCRGDKKTEYPRKLLFCYAAITAAAAVFPLTAAVMMLYQTKFYDYEWIWSAVPVTLILACGMAVLYLKWYRESRRKTLFKALGVAGTGLVLLFLCGNLGSPGYDGQKEAAAENKAALLLDKLEQTGDTENICLWAPAEVLAYVRRLDGNIMLLYGRNMWEESLNAWSYDTYDPETRALYQWMEQLAETQQQETSASAGLLGNDAAIMCVEAALDKGVNCILIPEPAERTFSPVLNEVAKKMGYDVTQQAVEGYCIYRIKI